MSANISLQEQQFLLELLSMAPTSNGPARESLGENTILTK
jgi:hypothetical protein